MANKINFVTGETYTLAELFSGERCIIIPDLQRDYCWGDETNQKSSGEVGELVSDFILNLMELYDSKEQGTLNIGLFYGYEIPANHIQLCDGQQRLTTLFLLVGMLNKKCGKFRHHLISDFEYKHDDKEPYLNYSIRETSIYFLSDLVCRFFISNTDRVDEIKKVTWYFADYDHDPSIQSMLKALAKIESLLMSKDSDWAVLFGDWVLNKLTFLYFDMQNRKNGEETFVVINTTGEPLSSTQNLKPLVIQEKNGLFDNTNFCAKQPNGKSLTADSCWEQIETWFWRKRKGDNDTADAGFAEFLRWVYMIKQYTVELPKDKQTSDKKFLIQDVLQGKGEIEFPYKEIPFSEVYSYWETLVWIYDKFDELKFNYDYLSPASNNSVNKRKAIGQNDCFCLLPVLKYVHDKVDINAPTEIEKRNCMRIYEFFCNLIRIDNVTKAVNTLVGETLKIIDLIDGYDIVSILNKSNVSKQILTEEERCKLEIFRDSNNRDEVENEFWKLQSHPIWNGEILPIIKMAQNDNGQFDFDKFKDYSNVFYLLFSGNMEHEQMAHLLRRCMIVSMEHYKPVLRRGTYSSFAWEWGDWNKILSGDIDNLRTFFDYVLGNIEKQAKEKILEEYILNFVDAEKDFSEFAIDDFLLNLTNRSRACDMIWDLNDWQICTSGGTGKHTSFFSRRNAYILKAYGANWKNNRPQNKRILENQEWGVWYWCDSHNSNCVVFERKNVKLDVRFLSDNNDCEIILKSLDNNDITTLAERLNFEMKKNSVTECISIYHVNSFDVSKIKDKVDLIMNSISEFYYCTKQQTENKDNIPYVFTSEKENLEIG